MARRGMDVGSRDKAGTRLLSTWTRFTRLVWIRSGKGESPAWLAIDEEFFIDE